MGAHKGMGAFLRNMKYVKDTEKRREKSEQSDILVKL